MNNLTKEKINRQLKLEKEQSFLGYENATKSIESNISSKRESSSLYGVMLLKKNIEPLSNEIKALINHQKDNKGRKNSAVKFFSEFDNCEKIAYLSLRQVINSISSEVSLSKLAVSIGSLLEKELLLMDFKKNYPEIYKNIEKFVTTNNEHHRYASMRAIYNKQISETKKLDINLKAQIGVKIIDIIISKLNIIKIEKVIDRKTLKQKNIVLPTDKCLSIINQYKNNALLTPEYMPMVAPPKNWTNPFDGGYYTIGKSINLVKARFDEKNYLNNLHKNSSQMEVLYKSINAIQNTPYVINKKVLSVMEYLYNNGVSDVLPKKDEKKLPICPVCNEEIVVNSKKDKHNCFLLPENKEKFIKWKKEAEEVYAYNNSLFGKQIQVSKILYLANKFKDEDSIYFVYQLDFRGRAYSVASYLQPQGSDYAKGLLNFAEKRPLIDFDSVKWLAIHGANLFGIDKVSFDDRLLWVLENEEKIIEVAKNPTENLWWTNADKPFQFLNFVFEWSSYVECCEREEVFYSSLPVAMDGTCNGLQIFSLLTKDKEAGYATNLINTEKPMDIYGIVADKVKEILKSKINSNIKIYSKNKKEFLYDEKELSKKLLQLNIDRKATKRQVMTLPYGATQNSCKEYTYQWLLTKKNEKALKNENIFQVAIFLSKIIWQAIDETLTGAKKAMAYLRLLAEIASNNNLPICWTTPIGFQVVQWYKEEKHQRVKTLLGGSILFVSVKEESKKINMRSQKNGISPNFIHSLDAAAMMKTIDICVDKGVSSFLVVHDSFATHADKASILSLSIREAFYNIFQEDLLTKFKNEILVNVTDKIAEKIPKPIEKGNLDIKEILNSKYFFA